VSETRVVPDTPVSGGERIRASFGFHSGRYSERIGESERAGVKWKHPGWVRDSEVVQSWDSDFGYRRAAVFVNRILKGTKLPTFLSRNARSSNVINL
jgi:hypothetical protein